MITAKEVKTKIEREVEKISNEFYSRLENKMNEKIIDNSIIIELLAKGKVYVGYSYRVREAQRDYGYDDNSIAWESIMKKVSIIIDKRLEDAGWKLEDNDFLVPIEEKTKE